MIVHSVEGACPMHNSVTELSVIFYQQLCACSGTIIVLYVTWS